MRLIAAWVAALLWLLPIAAPAQPAPPDPALAAGLLGLAEPIALDRVEVPVAGWIARGDGATEVGFIASTWEVSGSLGYSGKPLDVLVAIDPAGILRGARLVAHSEPILTLGLSDDDIAGFVDGFPGVRLVGEGGTGPLPDTIARATVSSGAIRDGILRTARAVANGRLAGGIDRTTFVARSWADLMAMDAVTQTSVSMAEAAGRLSGAQPPIAPSESDFLRLWAAVIDPPGIGQNLFGPALYSEQAAARPPDAAILMVASRGLQSHRGTAWRQSGRFDRIALLQDGRRVVPEAAQYTRVGAFDLEDAPDPKEISLFALPADQIDPTKPFSIEVTASRNGIGGPVSFTTRLDYALPAAFLVPSPPALDVAPAWHAAWQSKRAEIAGVVAMLTVLTGLLFFQHSAVRRPRVWLWLRTGFLTVTLVWLGWIVGGQLSVVQVVAFLHAIMTGFRWDVFLMEPVIFLLWGFTALGLLFWGRGVFCGWLCPFGALQELMNATARRLGVPQVALPYGVHERLWVIKYTLFLAILGLSFHSMAQAQVLAEAEPFKTAFSLRFDRAWPFIAFVVALLTAGLFIERFYCRYLCPLGAALAIPAKLKIFDWLRRRPQCGRECRLCETRCTVGAIDPIGRINPNECILCLRCQMIFSDPKTCPVLKRRKPQGTAA